LGEVEAIGKLKLLIIKLIPNDSSAKLKLKRAKKQVFLWLSLRITTEKAMEFGKKLPKQLGSFTEKK
jgi:hypothetical protein